MHSRIFQVSENPIPQSDFATALDMPDWFTDSGIADYVSDEIGEREQEIGFLAGCLQNIAGVDGNKLTFKSDISAYFNGSYATFVELAKKYSEMTKEDFCSESVFGKMHLLNEMVEDKYGYYVLEGEWLTPVTLDRWLRRVKPGAVYYIGGIIDYHF